MRDATRALRLRRRPRLESMESRYLLSTFTVTNANDSGAGSLRQAILDANGAAGADLIDFAIPGDSAQVIRPASGLPAITDPVTIDGFTQSGAHPDVGAGAAYRIGLDGSAAGASVDGLIITGGGSTVRGLAITGFRAATGSISDPQGGNGILLQSGGGNVIAGNYLGLDVTGAAGGNAKNGLVVLPGSTGNTIGGATAALRNVASGNTSAGIAIAADSNLVTGNYAGLDPTGQSALPNGVGIAVAGGTHNTIGGPTAGERNVASGNRLSGIALSNPYNGTVFRSDSNLVVGNYVGTDSSGTRAVGNAGGATIGGHLVAAGNFTDLPVGIYVEGSFNTIGGAGAGLGNVISGNFDSGLQVEGQYTTIVMARGRANLIQGNLIGTDASGTRPLGNASPSHPAGSLQGDGAIFLGAFATQNTVGGTVAGAGNIIGYNAGVGVGADALSSLGNILGNVIFSNGRDGVVVSQTKSVVLSNSIYNNGGAGIVATPAAPVLTSVTASGGSTVVRGTLSRSPSTSYQVQFFADRPPNGAAAEGRTLLGETTVTTDASGAASFDAILPVALSPGQVVTATATAPSEGTSPFSEAVSQPIDLSLALSTTPAAPRVNGTIRVTIAASNTGPGTATGVIITFTVPPGLQFVSSDAGTFDASSGVVTVPVGSIEPGGRASVTVTLLATKAGSFSGTAQVKADQADPTPGDDRAPVNATVLPDGPRVIAVGRAGHGSRLILAFDMPLSAKPAKNRRNYRVRLAASGGGKAKSIGVSSARYNAANGTVKLQLGQALKAKKSYVLTVVGMPPNGLAAPGGPFLDGTGAGQPGTDYVATLAPVEPVASKARR